VEEWVDEADIEQAAVGVRRPSFLLFLPPSLPLISICMCEKMGRRERKEERGKEGGGREGGIHII